MTDREGDLLALRYMEVEAVLRAIFEGRVVDGVPAAAMMAGIAGHVWSFDELFSVVLGD